MPIFSSWSFHTQVPSVILTVVSVMTICVVDSKERVEEVASQGLRADLIITTIHVYWLLKTKGMDTF